MRITKLITILIFLALISTPFNAPLASADGGGSPDRETDKITYSKALPWSDTLVQDYLRAKGVLEKYSYVPHHTCGIIAFDYPADHALFLKYERLTKDMEENKYTMTETRRAFLNASIRETHRELTGRPVHIDIRCHAIPYCVLPDYADGDTTYLPVCGTY